MKDAGKSEVGTVKWFNSAKGYGFIQRQSGDDIFVHFSAIVGSGYRSLTPDQVVEFEIASTPKGLQAIDVRLADPEPSESASRVRKLR
jgi:CspA family cold shock protein